MNLLKYVFSPPVENRCGVEAKTERAEASTPRSGKISVHVTNHRHLLGPVGHISSGAPATRRKHDSFDATSMDFIVGVAFVVALYLFFNRLYFCPVAAFPGPRLAALTFWYEFYYDVVCKGRYTWKIQQLHEKYGMSSLRLFASRHALFRPLLQC